MLQGRQGLFRGQLKNDAPLRFALSEPALEPKKAKDSGFRSQGPVLAVQRLSVRVLFHPALARRRPSTTMTTRSSQ
jgi:hypothetical protein